MFPVLLDRLHVLTLSKNVTRVLRGLLTPSDQAAWDALINKIIGRGTGSSSYLQVSSLTGALLPHRAP